MDPSDSKTPEPVTGTSIELREIEQEPSPTVPPPTYSSAVTPVSTEREAPERSGMEHKGLLICIGGVIGVIALILAIVLPLSYSSLEYYQLGFTKRKTTGEINRDTVYGPGGRHLIGPEYEFRTFDSDAHFETFSGITVFSADRLQVSISANVQYFLRKHQLALLHTAYDIAYRNILKNNALDAIKITATKFTTREYLRERDRVENALWHAVRERLGGPCCELNCNATGSCFEGCTPFITCRDAGLFVDVRYFQLTQFSIPNELEVRFLRGLILREQADTERYKQTAQVVRKETDALVQQIGNEAQEISANAQAESSLVSSMARANATAVVEDARRQGLRYLYSELSIVRPEHKASFDYLRTLRAHENVHFAVDYQTLVQGPTTAGSL